MAMVQPVVTKVSGSRVARAEARRNAELAQQERARASLSSRYQDENRESEVRAQAARMGVMVANPDLRSAIGWFKREWQAALPRAMHEGADTVEPEDVLGAPALTHRWRSYLYGQAGTGDAPEPIRAALRDMATSDLRYERCAAAFLFAMACMDFDAVAAGLEINGHCLCGVELPDVTRDDLPHADPSRACAVRILPLSPEYAPYYAQQAIRRLQQCVVRFERRPPRALPEPEWKARLQIGKSEAQATAEADA